LAVFVSATHYFSANDTATYIQDELLSANAAAEVGNDARAYDLACAALAREANRPDARRIALVSHFNLAVSGASGADTVAAWRKELPLLDGLELRDPTLALVAGVAWWKTGDQEHAVETWAVGVKRFGVDSAPGAALAVARQATQPTAGKNPDANAGMLDYLTRPQ
jgi:hypothetical protein